MARALGADRRRRRQRGAISFMMPSVLILSVLVGALAIDVGRMAWNRRQLQEIVDLGAIDAMRAFGQCRENPGDPVAAAQASAVRNGYAGNLATAPNAVQIGSVTTQADGVRTFSAGGVPATATAVRVFATRQVPFTLVAGSFLPGSATLQAEAVAAREAVGSLSAGSFAARVDTSSSPLLNQLFTQLIGGNVALDAISYQHLLGATFSVGDLMVAAGVASLDELLSLELSGSDYLELVATALSDNGETSAAGALNAIAGTASAASVPLSDVLDIATDNDEAAFAAQLNAFDMLDVGAQVARGDAAVVLDPLAVNLPGVSTSVQLKIVQAPRIAVGPPGRDADGEWNTLVRTGQVRMAIHLGLGNIPLLGLQQLVSADLFVEVAPTVAHLDAIDCADAGDPVHRVVVGAEPGLARLGIGKYPDFDNSPDPVPSELLSLDLVTLFVRRNIAKITGYADVPFQSSEQDLRFDGPFVPQIEEPSEDNTQTVGTPVGDSISNALAGLLGQTTLNVQLTGLGTLTLSQRNTALAAVANALQPVLTAFDAPLMQLFDALGLTLGGADVTVLSLNADQPALAR